MTRDTTSSDAFWRRWCAENTAPRPEADALSLQAACELVREVETPSFLLGIREAHGRCAIEFGQEADKLVDYLHPTSEARLRRFLMTRRVVPDHDCISAEEANLDVTGYFEVKLEELDSKRWKVVWPNGREETLDRPRTLLDWLQLLEEKT